MRSKDEILKHIVDAYTGKMTPLDKLLITLNISIEVLLDIRDILDQFIQEDQTNRKHSPGESPT